MNLFRKTVGLVAIASIVGLHFPQISRAMQNPPSSESDKALGITEHDPEFLAPPEIEIPVETTIEGKKKEKKKTSKWVWIGAGVLITGAIAAAASGGGDGNSGKSSQQGEGEITVQWNEQ
ncbi:MAG: hypothetical protein AB1611_02695 [bacterium]